MYARATNRHLAEIVLFLAALLAGMLPPAAWARTADRELPVEIEAGTFVDDPLARTRTFSGGVVLRQGTLTVRADEAVIEIGDAGELERARLTGEPVTWREELDDGLPLSAQARRIDYDFASEQVVLRRDVVIDRGTDRITGEQIRYDLTTSRLDAGGGDGRVRFRITPQRSEEDDGGP